MEVLFVIAFFAVNIECVLCTNTNSFFLFLILSIMICRQARQTLDKVNCGQCKCRCLVYDSVAFILIDGHFFSNSSRRIISKQSKSFDAQNNRESIHRDQSMIAFLSVFSIATAACIQIQFACKKNHRRETPFTNQKIKHRNEKPIDHDLLLTRLIFIWLFNIHPFWECFVCISVLCVIRIQIYRIYVFFLSLFTHQWYFSKEKQTLIYVLWMVFWKQ